MTPDDTRDDLAATLQARRDLGPDYDEALASRFVERLERDIDARLDARLGVRRDTAPSRADVDPGRRRDGDGDGALPLAIVSLALGIPLTAISASLVGFFGLLLVWVGIVGVNVAYALHRRPPR